MKQDFKKLNQIKVGTRVKVGPFKHDGFTPHPQAGKTGVISQPKGTGRQLIEMMYISGVAQVEIDAEFEDAGNIMIISFECLELA